MSATSIPEQGTTLKAAAHYAGLGIPVFPCVPGRKEPLTERGLHDATTDAEQIERWWTERPNANVGISTGGLLVVDLDTNNTWLADDQDKLLELAVAPMSLTANGGWQYLFRQPVGKQWRNTVGRLAPHVDTRAGGGLTPTKICLGRAPHRGGAAILTLNSPAEIASSLRSSQ